MRRRAQAGRERAPFAGHFALDLVQKRRTARVSALKIQGDGREIEEKYFEQILQTSCLFSAVCAEAKRLRYLLSIACGQNLDSKGVKTGHGQQRTVAVEQ